MISQKLLKIYNMTSGIFFKKRGHGKTFKFALETVATQRIADSGEL
jgi:hypothetical protein